MRGSDQRSGSLFSCLDLEDRVRPDHPLRPIRAIVNAALERLSREFDALYSNVGRPSIPPEPLLRALLLQAFYGIRSERQIIARLEYDLLFRWSSVWASTRRPGTRRYSPRTATGCSPAMLPPVHGRGSRRSKGAPEAILH
jgi:hypothetical protein